MLTVKINGIEIAEKILHQSMEDCKNLASKPTLAVIKTTADPASDSYILQKQKAAARSGSIVKLIDLSGKCEAKEFVNQINILNENKNINGIIIQRPVSETLKNIPVLSLIKNVKDIDGFNPESPYIPPISLAVLKIWETIKNLRGGNRVDDASLKSNSILILGVGETGGGPIHKTFVKMKIPHKTADANTPEEKKLELIKNSDVIISCVGKPNLVTGKMIKEGAICIGVGISRAQSPLCREKDFRISDTNSSVPPNPPDPSLLTGDFEEQSIQNIASFYTPTPGGIGPLNVAFLVSNLITAAKTQLSSLL